MKWSKGKKSVSLEKCIDGKEKKGEDMEKHMTKVRLSNLSVSKN